MPNAVMDNQFIYNFRNLYELNLQAKLTNYVVQINDKSILGRFTNIRLRKLQNLMWIPDNPLLYPFSMTNYRWNSFNNNFHFNMIMLCRQNNFSFSHSNYEFASSTSAFKIKGGSISLESLFKTDYYKYIKSLKKKMILFLEQITSLDGKSLLEWFTLHQKTFIPPKYKCYTHSPTKWYNHLLTNVTIDSSTTLLPQYTSPPSNDYNGWHFAQPSIRNQFKEYVAVWIQLLNCAIMGKVLKKS